MMAWFSLPDFPAAAAGGGNHHPCADAPWNDPRGAASRREGQAAGAAEIEPDDTLTWRGPKNWAVQVPCSPKSVTSLRGTAVFGKGGWTDGREGLRERGSFNETLRHLRGPYRA
jgi:hypothetical protein